MADTAARGVFISYARTDAEIVSLAAKLLRAGGATVFQDVVDIEYGTRWQDELATAIRRCERVLVFWSAAAAASEWVEREWRAALGAGKRIVPMLLDQTPLPAALAGFNGMPDLMRLLTAASRGPVDAFAQRPPAAARSAPQRPLWWAGAGLGSLALLSIGVLIVLRPRAVYDTRPIPSVTASGVPLPASAPPDATVGMPGGGGAIVLIGVAVWLMVALAFVIRRQRRARVTDRIETAPDTGAPTQDALGAEFAALLFS